MDYDLQDLIECPRETENIELKRWLEIHKSEEKELRAKIARHLAALANCGGGYLIFGFDDDLTDAPGRPADLSHYSRDVIGGIIARHLDPTFQCDVVIVKRAGDGLSFPVICVPSHKAVPICAKKSGPSGQGIVEGVYYTRSPKPESIAIQTPLQWKEIINRCILHERESLLASISHLLTTPETRAAKVASWQEELGEWHTRSHQRYMELLSAVSPTLLAPLEENHYQLSYFIHEKEGETIHNKAGIDLLLDRANQKIRETVWTGWSMFYRFSREGIAPYVTVDEGSGKEVIETNLLSEANMMGLPDFWRMRFDGAATIIRAYREDRQNSGEKRMAGEWLGFEELVQNITEFVFHAKAVSESFRHADMIGIKASWCGLAGRKLNSFVSPHMWYGKECKTDSRTISLTTDPEQLSAQPEHVISNLANQILILFDGTEISPERVRQLIPSFKRL